MNAGGILVGRKAELATFDAALDTLADLDASSPSVMLALAGEPGIGKSRLLGELAARADAHGHVVLSGRAAELELDVPFGVFADALDDYLASLDAESLERLHPQVLAELATAFPSLAPFGVGHQAALQAERFRTHRAVRTLLEELGRAHPTVLLLDDVQWADPASRELLGYLLAYPPGGPVLVALAFRPAQIPAHLGQALAVANRDGRAHQLMLGPLSPAEADQLAGPTVAGETRAALYRESGGNPFYLEQLLRAGGAQLRARHLALGHDGSVVPSGVRAALAAELDSLPAEARTFLEAAAVAGDPFEADLAADVAGLSERQSLELLDRLVRCDLIRPTPIPRRFRFRHPVVRRAVHESSGVGWRVGAHARAATALAASDAPAAVRAHHIERSAKVGDESGISVLIEAGHTTASRAPATAAHWYGAALRLLPHDDPRGLELLVAQATALAAAGQLEDSHAALCEALEQLPSATSELGVVLTAARARRCSWDDPSRHAVSSMERWKALASASQWRRPPSRSS